MSAVLYLGSIVLANILVHSFGLVTVFGLTFPAGAVAIGLTFSARDFVQERYGKFGCWLWMLLASAITLAFNQHLALASVCAFFIAEFSDWAIYTRTSGSVLRLERKGADLDLGHLLFSFCPMSRADPFSPSTFRSMIQ